MASTFPSPDATVLAFDVGTRRIGVAMGNTLLRMAQPLVTIDEREFTPATYNNPGLARRLDGAFKGIFGEKHVVTRKPVMGGEDFSEYGRTADKIPICIFWLGSVEPERVAESERTGKPLPALHSNLYRPVPEPTIKTGVTAMTAAVLELVGKK